MCFVIRIQYIKLERCFLVLYLEVKRPSALSHQANYVNLPMPTRLVFLGSKPIGYQCLQYLLDKRQELDIEIVAVSTRLRTEFGAGNNLKELAEGHNIPLLDSLDDIPECDIIYSVQHHELLRERHIGKLVP